jgi:hypothetical protein
MNLNTPLARAAAILIAAGMGLSAQSPSALSFKMVGGPLGGQAKTVLGGAGFVMGADVNFAQKLGAESRLVYSFGFRYLPGDNNLLSYIPRVIAATNVNPSYYETRNRKTEGQGFHLGAMYQRDAWMEGMYYQVGLRVGRTKIQAVDTGTRITTNGLAIADTTTTTPSPNILAIDAIATNDQKSATSISPVLGLGYRFNDKYALELNVASVTVASPTAKSRNGLAAELAFSFNF